MDAGGFGELLATLDAAADDGRDPAGLAPRIRAALAEVGLVVPLAAQPERRQLPPPLPPSLRQLPPVLLGQGDYERSWPTPGSTAPEPPELGPVLPI